MHVVNKFQENTNEYCLLQSKRTEANLIDSALRKLPFLFVIDDL
jgi:hypothetical protein